VSFGLILIFVDGLFAITEPYVRPVRVVERTVVVMRAGPNTMTASIAAGGLGNTEKNAGIGWRAAKNGGNTISSVTLTRFIHELIQITPCY
jgi:hypothetical protein